MVAIDLIVQHVHSQLEEVREVTLAHLQAYTHTLVSFQFNMAIIYSTNIILIEHYGPSFFFPSVVLLTWFLAHLKIRAERIFSTMCVQKVVGTSPYFFVSNCKLLLPLVDKQCTAQI